MFLPHHQELAGPSPGKPSRSIINLISNTTTDHGPHRSRRKSIVGSYPTGIKVTDEQLAAVNMTPDTFHGDWNYSIQPGKRKK